MQHGSDVAFKTRCTKTSSVLSLFFFLFERLEVPDSGRMLLVSWSEVDDTAAISESDAVIPPSDDMTCAQKTISDKINTHQ